MKKIRYNSHMSSTHYSTDLFRGSRSIATFAIFGAVIALLASFIQPLQYSSSVRLLILEQTGSVDAYTASRSVERLSENFATIIFTTAFFDQVMNAGFDIDKNRFSEKEYKRRKQWSRMVDTTVSRGTGLLSIDVYHPDVDQAEQIVNAIAFILRRDADQYVPGGSIEIRLVDTALNSRWPVRPNIPANIFSGFILGGLIGVAYILLQAEKLRRRHQYVHDMY